MTNRKPTDRKSKTFRSARSAFLRVDSTSPFNAATSPFNCAQHNGPLNNASRIDRQNRSHLRRKRLHADRRRRRRCRLARQRCLRGVQSIHQLRHCTRLRARTHCDLLKRCFTMRTQYVLLAFLTMVSKRQTASPEPIIAREYIKTSFFGVGLDDF